ncbi:PTS system mannose/fructose/N-acetylgalactosamine-transporter subunit IIB [Hungatella hominis]|uniref:PTS sugar transporter subunit IIB n=1 Tax=Hungatella hominis TaxID=2763050 RepID=A0ABR7H9S2_9FIRM|nr:PTS sugar transporter subunit IIB [Hungatella hominis]MBC5709944.1 PTS sugar transporter subunit IIB [Hungatella hominis]
MIPSLRIDDRLIHGQIALVWSKAFGTNRIVVANDKAVTDEVTNVSLQMAVPTGIKLLIKTVDDAVKLFHDPRAAESSIFVLTNCIADAVRIVKACPGMIQSVNVANAGRFDTSPSSEKLVLSSTIIVNKAELEALKELAAMDIPAYQQVIPSDAKKPVKDLLKGH